MFLNSLSFFSTNFPTENFNEEDFGSRQHPGIKTHKKCVKMIVDILSNFDTLCNDKEKGLPAEIALREQQFTYYRDKLLLFEKVGD